jgi:amino acid transporter
MTDSTIATGGILFVALVVGVLGLWVTRRGKHSNEDRRQRWILKGMRPLILCGACAVAVIMASQLYPQDFGLDTKLTADEAKQLSQLSQEDREIIKAAGFDRNELDQLFKANPVRLDRRIARVKPFLTMRPPVWPVLLAAAGFLYLWWLATLIFDLAFVWQRYVRRSVANQRLREWGPQDLRRSAGDPDQPEACRNLERPSSKNGEGR